MTRDAQASVRLPTDLKRDIEKVANATSRTLSSTMELLLRRGIDQFNRDGVLIELPQDKRHMETFPTVASGTEDLAARIAQLVVEQMSGRARPPNRGRKKRGAAA